MKRNFLIGMAGISLALGMTVIGCDTGTGGGTGPRNGGSEIVRYTSGSYTLVISGGGVSANALELSANIYGSETAYSISDMKADVVYNYKLSDSSGVISSGTVTKSGSTLQFQAKMGAPFYANVNGTSLTFTSTITKDDGTNVSIAAFTETGGGNNGGDNGGGGNTGGGTITFTDNPISVQAALNKELRVEHSANTAKFHKAAYDEKLGYVVVTYKVGTMKNMFLQYLSNVITAGPGRKFTYSEVVGSVETQQIENINMTIASVGGRMVYAVAGASASAGLKGIDGVGADAVAGASAGDFNFDLKWVSENRYTTTYTQYLQVSQTLEQDMSIYPAGKKYAVTAFADVGIYQILKFNPGDKTATAIPGQSLWFNIESRPIWDMYEYIREEELQIADKLMPFERVSVQVNEADLYKSLKKEHTETRPNDLFDIGASSRDETIYPNFSADILKHFGYKVRIDISYDFKAESILGGSLRLQIANADKSSELGRKDASQSAFSWGDTSYSLSNLDIASLKSPTCTFMLLWSKTGTAEYRVSKRTITIRAIK
jgi:hypothetical protein